MTGKWGISLSLPFSFFWFPLHFLYLPILVLAATEFLGKYLLCLAEVVFCCLSSSVIVVLHFGSLTLSILAFTFCPSSSALAAQLWVLGQFLPCSRDRLVAGSIFTCRTATCHVSPDFSSPMQAPGFPHTLRLVHCSTGLTLMFPGQMWQGTVKGQSLNEPLWDLPQLLTISLQLIRQGIAALAVSLHHSPPLPFPPEPPARSTQTNQLSMKIQIGSFFLESSFSLALTQVSQTHINLCFFLPLLALPLSGTCWITYWQLSTHLHIQTRCCFAHKAPTVSICICLCKCALMKTQERDVHSLTRECLCFSWKSPYLHVSQS